MTVIQTTCRHCGHEIEGVSPWRLRSWRDRGNNWTCPKNPRKPHMHVPMRMSDVYPARNRDRRWADRTR